MAWSLIFCLAVLTIGSIFMPKSQGRAKGFTPLWQRTRQILLSTASPSQRKRRQAGDVANQDASPNDNDDNNNSNEPPLVPLQWWNDLAPPFAFPDDPMDLDHETTELSSSDSEDGGMSTRSANGGGTTHTAVTHFCFLVHGHRGFSRDLGYLQAKMERVAAQKKRKNRVKLRTTKQHASSAASVEANGETVPAAPADELFTDKKLQHQEQQHKDQKPIQKQKSLTGNDLVVHAAICNERKTDDGIVNGGERLFQEMLQVIRTEMSRRANHHHKKKKTSTNADDNNENIQPQQPQYLTISMLGNSLGGMYARYAVSELYRVCKKGDHGDLILDDRYHIHFNVFCTTATPHLGIAGHTYLPLPRTAEIGVAHAMGDTGKDLFRVNDLMKRMAISTEFVEPLRAFRKRIAYANAYGTDFPVPLQTAAFLSESSSYPHHFVEDSIDNDRLVLDDNGLVIATLHTPAMEECDINSDNTHNHPCFVDDEESDELVRMSRSLDSLGWKKVFVDVRKEIPRITIPVSSLLRRSNSGSFSIPVLLRRSNSGPANHHNTTDATASAADTAAAEEELEEHLIEPIQRLKKKGVVTSKDVAAALSNSFFSDETFHWPMGHNMIVAFSRGRFSTYINKAGRPVVDCIAHELVKSIMDWSLDLNQPEVETTSSSSATTAAVETSSSDKHDAAAVPKLE